MKYIKPIIIYTVVIGACGIFIWGIHYAGKLSKKCNNIELQERCEDDNAGSIATDNDPNCCNNCEHVPPIILTIITGLAGVLATNLGTLTGLLKSQYRTYTLRPSLIFRRSTNVEEDIRNAQILASVLFVSGLIYAFILWGKIGGFQENACVEAIIKELSRSLAGIVVGVVAIALGVPGKNLRVQ